MSCTFFFGSSSWKGSTLFFCFWVRSSPLVSRLLHPHLLPLTPAPLQAGFPGLCQHAEWGGVLRPSWTRCPAAPHSSVSGPVEKCPPAADWERSAARQSVCSPACVCDPSHPVYLCDNIWLRLNFFFPFPLILCLCGYQLPWCWASHVLSRSGCEAGLRGGPAAHPALPPRRARWWSQDQRTLQDTADHSQWGGGEQRVGAVCCGASSADLVFPKEDGVCSDRFAVICWWPTYIFECFSPDKAFKWLHICSPLIKMQSHSGWGVAGAPPSHKCPRAVCFACVHRPPWPPQCCFTEHANVTQYLDRLSFILKHKDMLCRLDAGSERGAFSPHHLPVHVSSDDLMFCLFSLF